MEAKIAGLEARPDDAYAYMQHVDPITGAQLCVMRPSLGASLVWVERGLNGKVLWRPDVLATHSKKGWHTTNLSHAALDALRAITRGYEFLDGARPNQ